MRSKIVLMRLMNRTVVTISQNLHVLFRPWEIWQRFYLWQLLNWEFLPNRSSMSCLRWRSCHAAEWTDKKRPSFLFATRRVMQQLWMLGRLIRNSFTRFVYDPSLPKVTYNSSWMWKMQQTTKNEMPMTGGDDVALLKSQSRNRKIT